MALLVDPGSPFAGRVTGAVVLAVAASDCLLAVAFLRAVSDVGSWLLRSSVPPTAAEAFSIAFTAGVLMPACAKAQCTGARASNEKLPTNSAFFISITRLF